MIVYGILYTLNISALLLGLFVFCLDEGEKRFSLALLQVMFCLPLLVGEYMFLAAGMASVTLQLVLFSEIIFALVWLSMTMNLHRAAVTTGSGLKRKLLGETIVGAITASAAGYFLAYRPVEYIVSTQWAFGRYSPVYFSSMLILLIVLYGSWRLEQFWHSLNVAHRWEYKSLVLGCYLVSGAFAWCSSYRLTYYSMEPRHLHLLAALLFMGWVLMAYGVVNHRLLNRKIFISRKIIYSSVVPVVLAAYLLGFGAVVMIVRHYELELSYVLKWLLVITGFMVTIVVITSEGLRQRLKFYISTHFYINKYEYRDEWLALSEHLQGATTEREVVNALRQVLNSCLYTQEIFIWLSEAEPASSGGYKYVDFFDNTSEKYSDLTIRSDNILVDYLKKTRCFYLNEEKPDQQQKHVVEANSQFFTVLNLKLMAPIAIGDHLVGIIGLGPEFTGGEYGHDDFDLLKALGSQVATALLAVRMAEQLAHAREQQAWNRLAAFVLHDIKNAATMLGLLRANGPEHIHEPEFQQDMFELVDDALGRMSRVEERLQSLQNEIQPSWHRLDLDNFLRSCIGLMKKKLPALKISVDCPKGIQLESDPDLLTVIMENLLLNSFETGNEEVEVHVQGRMDNDGHVCLEVRDNGPGIVEELLQDRLFEPFKTSKPGGSGIGLWQVKKIVACLGGTVSADNPPEGGARFSIRLPLNGVE